MEQYDVTAVVAWLRSQGPSVEAAAHHAERQGLDGCVLTELLGESKQSRIDFPAC